MSGLDSRLAILLLLSGVAVAQNPQVLQTGEVAPTAFESFVADPAVIVVQERSLGRFQGTDTAIAINALEAEDRANPGSSRRGVRVDLATNAWRTSVFLDEDQLAELSRDLRWIAVHRNEFENAPDPEQLYGWRGRGTAACWLPREPQRILCPNYLIQEGFQSFSINVYGSDQSFPFTTGKLSDVANVFEVAKNDFEAADLFERTNEPEQSELPSIATRAEPLSQSVASPLPTQPASAINETIAASAAKGADRWLMILAGLLFACVALLVVCSLFNWARK